MLLFDRGGIPQDSRLEQLDPVGSFPLHTQQARAEQMTMLRELAGEMEQLSIAIERMGGQVPSKAIPYVYDFFDLADALLLQEVKNKTGSNRKSDGWVVYPSTEDE